MPKQIGATALAVSGIAIVQLQAAIRAWPPQLVTHGDGADQLQE